MIKDTIIFLMGAAICLFALGIAIWDYYLRLTNKKTISDKAKELLLEKLEKLRFWLLVGLISGFILGVILGFILGHLFWPQIISI